MKGAGKWIKYKTMGRYRSLLSGGWQLQLSGIDSTCPAYISPGSIPGTAENKKPTKTFSGLHGLGEIVLYVCVLFLKWSHLIARLALDYAGFLLAQRNHSSKRK